MQPEIKTPAEFEVVLGCEEWQETTLLPDRAAVDEYLDSWNGIFSQGLYPATFGWVENLLTGEREELIHDDE